MALPKNILYPVDFSERCRAAWPAIRMMARQLGIPITVFHVLDTGHWEGAELAGGFEAIRQHVQQQLNCFPAPSLDLPNVRRELAEGPAAECIVQRAARMETPLIMLPTRGHTRFRQLLLGSVTAAVLHDAACAVWTEAHTDDRPLCPAPYRSMVCAIDMGPGTPELLQAASEFSRQFGASLHIVHAVPRGDPRFPSGLADRSHAVLVDAARGNFPVHCQKAGVDFSLEILEDYGLVNAIAGAIAKHNADLLVIGRGVIQGPLGRLRTNAHDLIRHSPCAVLSI